MRDPDLENICFSDRLNRRGVSNALTANDNYPVQDSGNFSCAIQMHLSFKQKIFSDFFVLFLDSTSNFKHFEKKDDSHSYFGKLDTVKELVRPLFKKH